MIPSLVLAAALGTAAPGCESTPVAQQIEQQRERFNDAIRTADLDAIKSVLAEDVVLVAGTHSDQFIGREAQLTVWRQEFERGDERLVYVRTTTCITASNITSMAMETGQWRGEDPAGNFSAGRYTAKWRNIEGTWRLEAELFMTERCGGASCPETAERGD
jgi:ketosteroid isomerase-like protein